ncbi:Proansamycin X synthase [Bacillus sp. THAF10]|uniref:arylamine N-acetyltransferase n=1 Tax=Bacillus sp. THAF10 TaxID=2587848 RepID=UPI001268B19A|nr:arylamine N-acetyltransferase [Bacillus sp. THAF10]QFT87826.1 Proansamycin X synthase [Bacillus sp. THAF10]
MGAKEKFLHYLGVTEKSPSITYLNELIYAHQFKVRWETWTKFLDFEELEEKDFYLPSIDDYVERVVSTGTGGTCWTLARGFHFLLSELGFDVEYLYMKPGHLCLQVTLDQAYYVDVGYCAPLYKAYPLRESFTVVTEMEIFRYQVDGKEVLVEREPGPTKTLSLHPVSWEEMKKPLLESHNWTDGFAFQSLRMFGYIEGEPIQLRDSAIRRFKNQAIKEEALSPEELRFWIEEKFQSDYTLFERAAEIKKIRINKEEGGGLHRR